MFRRAACGVRAMSGRSASLRRYALSRQARRHWREGRTCVSSARNEDVEHRPGAVALSPGLDLLNNRIGSIARWIHRIACKVERRVEMKTRLVIVSLRHMAHQAQDFALLVDDDRFAFLGPKIKPPTLASISESHHLERE